jgi:phage-related holin
MANNNKHIDIQEGGVFLAVILKTIMAVVMALCAYVVALIMDNINMFITVFLIEVVDFLFGIIIAYKNKNIQLKKGLNFLWTTVSYWMILTVVLSVEASHPAASWISEAIFLPILLFQLISILKKASILGVIPQGLLLEILERIEYKKKSFLESSSDTEPQTNQSDQDDSTIDRPPVI